MYENLTKSVSVESSIRVADSKSMAVGGCFEKFFSELYLLLGIFIRILSFLFRFHRYSIPGSVNVPLGLDEEDDVTGDVLNQSPSAAQLIERVRHLAVLVIVAGQGVTKKHVNQVTIWQY